MTQDNGCGALSASTNVAAASVAIPTPAAPSAIPTPAAVVAAAAAGPRRPAITTAATTRNSASAEWLSGGAALQRVDSPVWNMMVTHVASLGRAPASILDLASGPGEPACSLAARFPRARVTASDIVPTMLTSARARAKNLRLKRVQVCELDMTDLSSISTGSIDIVTVCLGLHLIPEGLQQVLGGISRVLKPGGHCVATLWDDAPLVEACLRTMQDMTGRPWSLPHDQLAHCGGRMDPLWATAGLTPTAGHNTILAVPLNLGPIGGSSRTWWVKGPVAVLPRLANCPADELDELKDAFRSRFRAEGLVTSRGDLELRQHCRLMSLRKGLVVVPGAAR